MSDPLAAVMILGRRSSEYLTPEQIAERLKVATKSVHEMFRSGMLPGFKLGRLWRIAEADFERWVQAQKKMPSREPADTVEAPRTVTATIRRRA